MWKNIDTCFLILFCSVASSFCQNVRAKHYGRLASWWRDHTIQANVFIFFLLAKGSTWTYWPIKCQKSSWIATLDSLLEPKYVIDFIRLNCHCHFNDKCIVKYVHKCTNASRETLPSLLSQNNFSEMNKLALGKQGNYSASKIAHLLINAHVYVFF